MMPAATKGAPVAPITSAISSMVFGLTALQSTYTGFGQLRVEHGGHAGGARAFGARLAAAVERGEHLHFIFSQALGDAGAHIAGRDDGDDRGHCFSLGLPRALL